MSTIVNYNSVTYSLCSFGDSNGIAPPPGGTRTTLTGDPTTFGGLTIDDIVISSVDAWTASNMLNSKTSALDVTSFATTGKLPFQQGVRTPGFFKIPICNSGDWITNTLGVPEVGDPSAPFFPCPNNS
jgi:hypothetical protein